MSRVPPQRSLVPALKSEQEVDLLQVVSFTCHHVSCPSHSEGQVAEEGFIRPRLSK